MSDDPPPLGSTEAQRLSLAMLVESTVLALAAMPAETLPEALAALREGTISWIASVNPDQAAAEVETFFDSTVMDAVVHKMWPLATAVPLDAQRNVQGDICPPATPQPR